MKRFLLYLLLAGNLFGQSPFLNYAIRESNFTDDYTPATWSLNSFDFDATNNVFVGDATTSTTLNNAIVGSNKQFTLSFWVRRKTPLATTQIVFCRDKSSATSARQINVFFSSTNKLVITLYTNSSNNISWTSTASFGDSRAWNLYTFVYDGTQGTVTNRLTVYTNGIAEPGATVQTGTFTTINNISSPNINIGGRVDAANFSTVKINNISLFNTNLSAASVALLYNGRVPFDIRTNSTLNTNLVSYLSADLSSTFSTNWAWTDVVGGGVFTSSGMVVGDLVADAPALKQISLLVPIGQSNQSGRVNFSEIEYKYQGSLSWLKMWNGNVGVKVFENANSVTNNNQYIETTGQYGIEYYLGSKINQYTKKTTYIFKVCQGGTYLSPLYTPSWCVPTPGVQALGGALWQRLYNNELPDLQDWELNNGFTITKISFIWIQGEADSQFSNSATTYETNWTNFLASVVNGRTKSYFYVTPRVYDCLLSSSQSGYLLPYKANVNTAKSNVAATNPTYYKVINTNAATINPADSIHYNKAGIRTISDSLFYRMKLDGL